MSAARELEVRTGFVDIVYAFDIGLGVDLERCRRHVTDLTEQAQIKHKGHAPTYFQFDPLPLRITQAVSALEIAGRRSSTSVEVTVYDFGGVSVRYTIPFDGPFEELIRLSCAITASDLFRTDSRARVAHLLAVIESAVDRPHIADVSEDYLVFRIEAFAAEVPLEDLWTRHAPTTARLLRSELDPLSDQEVTDAMSSRISFGKEDVALVDWNAALLVDREPEDVSSVLEFANLQLLEMRFLDSALDRALDRSYEVVHAHRDWISLLRPRRLRAEYAKVGRFQVDGAILFERVGNALKLLGDQYLARLYRATSQRFRLAEWNAAILRKLETIEGIYQKVHDRASGLRMELLEWIVIVLIALEIALSLVPAVR